MQRINPFKIGSPYTGTLANSEDPDEMPHKSEEKEIHVKS